MNPLALARFLANSTPTQTNSNPSHGASGLRVDNNYFNFFTFAQTYNSETFAAGDLLIGNNSSGEANLFWDESANTLYLRVGTTIKVSLDTDGIWVDNSIGFGRNDTGDVGSGGISIDHEGATYVRISASSGAFDVRRIVTGVKDGHYLILQNDTANNMSLINNYDSGSPPAGYHNIYTLTGTNITLEGYSSAQLIWTEAQSPAQWFLLGYSGGRSNAYSAFTGSVNRGTVYDTGTVTLVQLAERVAALQVDLRKYGIVT